MRIVIVGGVAAGASTAARARRLDESAEIVVLERGQHVSFANCGLPYHLGGVIKERDRLLLQTPRSLQATLNLDVRVGHEVLAIERGEKVVRVKDLAAGTEYRLPYDRLVLCPGASPIRPNLPGVDHPRVFVLRNIDDMDRIGAALGSGAKRAVVIGGGYIGVEMAENLRARGLSVDLVEMLDQIIAPLDREMARSLEGHLRWHGVRLHLGMAAAAFRDEEGRVRVELVNGQTLPADLVILAVGVKPDSALAKAAGLAIGVKGGIKVNASLQTSDPDIYAAGDAIEVVDAVTGQPAQIPLAGPANRQGRAVADNLFGRPTPVEATQGTAIVKVFEMTGGATGASEKTLRALKRPYRKAYLHPSGHAGYYPGTAPMHIKVVFDPADGKLLGAQVVGYDGVDKRLDVFATAIRAGLTVGDLRDLELAYAPPYGSARDPVNMAGFVASNVLSGDAAPWYAEDYPEQTRGGLILDVRGPDEFKTWHIPGAENLPLSRLRSRADELPKDRAIYLYCKVGFRSYLAYRLLRQRGFEQVRTLSGGVNTFCAWHGAGVCEGPPEPPVIPYAEEKTAEPPAAGPVAAGPVRTVELDLCGLQCPGPIRRLSDTIRDLAPGDEILACATDPGFAGDVPAWARRHEAEVVELSAQGPKIRARIRKLAPAPATLDGPAAGAAKAGNKKTMVVFSGELDKVLASFVIATGAASMGDSVTMFFTFWGLNALRRGGRQAGGKTFLDRMFGMMMPNGAHALKLSNLNMGGVGTALMKRVMRGKNVDSLPSLMAQARQMGVKIVACSMSMDVMGLKREELIDGVEVGGVAAFLGESEGAGMTLFI
jgi:NADPH-dependent 2,4-dienoyl-CoA reductase/sulfur reductase-like enzyme/peroxiredoxin family protein/rhodanese-related sulfurtransferase/TusA-related sulfurtransferase